MKLWTNTGVWLHRKKKNTCAVFSGSPRGAIGLRVKGESGKKRDPGIDLPGLFPSSGPSEEMEEMKQMMSHIGK